MTIKALVRREPWDRLPEEPSDWYYRFVHYYMQLGPERSLELGFRKWKETSEVGKAYKAKRLTAPWRKAAERWRWMDRAEAFDESLRRDAMAKHRRDVEEMNLRHGATARIAFNKIARRLVDLKPEEISPGGALHFLGEAMRLERLAAGEPIEIRREEHTGAGGGPNKTASIEARITDPAYMAQVLEIMRSHNAPAVMAKDASDAEDGDTPTTIRIEEATRGDGDGAAAGDRPTILSLDAPAVAGGVPAPA